MLSFFKRSLGQKVQLWIICASSWAGKHEEKKYERTVFRVKGGTKTVLVFGKIVIKHPAKNNEKSHRQEFQLTMANKASGTHSVSWSDEACFFVFFPCVKTNKYKRKRFQENLRTYGQRTAVSLQNSGGLKVAGKTKSFRTPLKFYSNAINEYFQRESF